MHTKCCHDIKSSTHYKLFLCLYTHTGTFYSTEELVKNCYTLQTDLECMFYNLQYVG